MSSLLFVVPYVADYSLLLLPLDGVVTEMVEKTLDISNTFGGISGTVVFFLGVLRWGK